jgi:hypothetical protein
VKFYHTILTIGESVVWVWLYIVQGVAIYFSHSGGAARKEGGEGEGDEGPSQAHVGLGQVTEIEI